MDVYHAVYPSGSAVDGMELETFCKLLGKRYGIDLASSWREDMTLGEIYEQTRREWPNKAQHSHVMLKKLVIVGLAVLCGVLAMTMFRFALSRTNKVPLAAAFVGYTNSSAGIAQAVFVITNRATDTLNLLTNYYIGGGQVLMYTRSTTPLTASALRLAPGAAVSVMIDRPAQSGAWRALFYFLPTRIPASYRLKVWLYRAGVRGMDMEWPTVSALSDPIDL